MYSLDVLSDYWFRDFLRYGRRDKDTQEYVYSFDMPGYEKEAIKLRVSERRIEIKADNKERGPISGTWVPEVKLDPSSVSADLKNGVLTIRAKPAEAANTREISIG